MQEYKSLLKLLCVFCFCFFLTDHLRLLYYHHHSLVVFCLFLLLLLLLLHHHILVVILLVSVVVVVAFVVVVVVVCVVVGIIIFIFSYAFFNSDIYQVLCFFPFLSITTIVNRDHC